jgi:protein TonB
VAAPEPAPALTPEPTVVPAPTQVAAPELIDEIQSIIAPSGGEAEKPAPTPPKPEPESPKEEAAPPKKPKPAPAPTPAPAAKTEEPAEAPSLAPEKPAAKPAPGQVTFYQSRIQAAVAKEWLRPYHLAYNGKTDLAATVRLRVRRDGTISDVTLTKASGNKELDESVLTAAKRVKQVPPLPESIQGKQYDVSCEFVITPVKSGQ